MNRALALRLAKARKSIHEAAEKQVADRKEAARRKWEWDHFEPHVSGQPDPNMSPEEYRQIIAEAKASHQNVFFGEGWRHPEQQLIVNKHLGNEPQTKLVVRSSSLWDALKEMAAGY